MANNVAMQAMYLRLGFSAAAGTLLTDAQGMDTLVELRILKDEEVDSLCKLLRRPGGMVVNPQANAAGQPAEIPAVGQNVSMRAVTNLKLACYFIRHQQRTSRTVVPGTVTLVRIRELRSLREEEEKHVSPPSKPTIIEENWSKTMEAILTYIQLHLGITKVPLAYVVRDSPDMPPGIDLRMGEGDSLYASHQDELTFRAPHYVAGGVPHLSDSYQI